MKKIKEQKTDSSSVNKGVAKPLVGGSFVITTDKEKFLREEFKYMNNVFDDDYKDYENVMSKDAMFCKTCGTYYWHGCKKRCIC